MERKKITIGLFGFGCVGEGLYQVLEQTPALNATIRKICIRHPEKKRSAPLAMFTERAEEIFEDDEINVIVELIDDAEAAYHLVKKSLVSGRPVVTANKKMLATHLPELLELQRLHDVPLLYEGACCASIPVIRNLEEYYDTDLVQQVAGIVNGSTNYILSCMEGQGQSFSQALSAAQASGYAESDPSLDVEGHDARYKLVLLLLHGFGLLVQPQEIFALGISRLGHAEKLYAQEKGLRIRLLAQAIRGQDGRITALVMPAFVKAGDQLHGVCGVFNGVRIVSAFSDSQFFMGRGAGAHPTGSAVISDLSALSYGYRYEYKKLGTAGLLRGMEEVTVRIFWRADSSVLERCGIYFTNVEETFISTASSHITGLITVSKMQALLGNFPDGSAILFDTVPEKHRKQQVFDLAMAVGTRSLPVSTMPPAFNGLV